VIWLEPGVIVAGAVSVTLCCFPASRVKEDGEAVSPAGTPLAVTFMVAVNEMISVAVIVTVKLSPPASVTVCGDADNEKSPPVCAGGVVPPPPSEPPATVDPPPHPRSSHVQRQKVNKRSAAKSMRTEGAADIGNPQVNEYQANQAG
jgi:hypothetical protein